MDDGQTTEDQLFSTEEVTTTIKESVEGCIGGNAYQHNKVNQWTTNVVEQCLNQLTKMDKAFKYIVNCVIMEKTGSGLHLATSCYWDNSTDVTCVIMQKNGAGLHTASSCFWDNSTDGSCTVRWENKTMYCIVSVFGLTI